jgi:hypothetical protein
VEREYQGRYSFLKKRTKKLLIVGLRAGRSEFRQVIRAWEESFLALFFQNTSFCLTARRWWAEFHPADASHAIPAGA